MITILQNISLSKNDLLIIWWFPKKFSTYERHLNETLEINGGSLIDNYRMRKQINKNKFDFCKKQFIQLSTNLEVKNIKLE